MLSLFNSDLIVEVVYRTRNMAGTGMRTTAIRTAGLAAAAVAAGLVVRRLVRDANAIDFRDRVVLISGGSRGLGLVLARHFGAEGARVAICARDEGELVRAAEDLKSRGVAVAAYVCDVSHRQEVAAVVAKVEQQMGPIDVLINNAGVVQVGPEDTMGREDFEEALNIHLYGPMNFVDAVLPHMRRRRFGRIANISSIGGRVAVPHMLPYCASKFALTGYSEGLRAELAASGIKVTTVCPGLMRTGSPRQGFFKGRHREEYTWFSISDSLPLLSIDADKAAEMIVQACRWGQAELMIGWPAQVATRAAGLFPGLTANVLSCVDRFVLPASNGDRSRHRGSESYSKWSPSPITVLNEKASLRNNEIF